MDESLYQKFKEYFVDSLDAISYVAADGDSIELEIVTPYYGEDYMFQKLLIPDSELRSEFGLALERCGDTSEYLKDDEYYECKIVAMSKELAGVEVAPYQGRRPYRHMTAVSPLVIAVLNMHLNFWFRALLQTLISPIPCIATWSDWNQSDIFIHQRRNMSMLGLWDGKRSCDVWLLSRQFKSRPSQASALITLIVYAGLLSIHI